MGLGRLVLGLLAASSLTIPSSPAAAQSQPLIVVRSGSLSSALHELARRTGAELMFDEASVRGLTARGLRGRMTVEAALDRLLGGTGLRWRRAASGAYVIERRAAPRAPAEPEADSPEPETIPDILITGKRTQNVDIRRREDDIQPYNVVPGRRIVRAHRDNIDQYFRSRVTQNAQDLPPSLLSQGLTVSEIDLRGLGADGTLILVDGRRLPSLPQGSPLAFSQPDINAVPLHAIDRVETLTGTAGGIYGFGAIGGVVNVILKRDYRGLDLHATAGISSRGDARRLGIEGRFGFTPNDGRTEVMAYLSHAWSEPLFEGQRGYAKRDFVESVRRTPEGIVVQEPTRNSVGVFAFFPGEELVLKPEYGGAAIGSSYTFLPLGFAGSPADLAGSLRANAGQIDLEPSKGAARTQLGSNPVVTSGLLTLRHRFSPGLEAFFDAVVLRNRGRHLARLDFGKAFLFPSSPASPFEQGITVTFPIEGRESETRVTVTTQRYTGGLIASLPAGWRGTAEASFGSAHYRRRVSNLGEYSDPFLFYFGFDDPDLAPFGSWEAFQQGLEAHRIDSTASGDTRNRFREQSLRLAGPLFKAAGGPVTLTLLGELRRERVPGYVETVTRGSTSLEIPSAPSSAGTRSFYGELRAPLGGPSAFLPFARNLELQLAIRHDRFTTRFLSNRSSAEDAVVLRPTFDAASFTAGAKSSPWPWLMLRGSYATGKLPPPAVHLIEDERISRLEFIADPKRENSFLSDEGNFLLKTGGFAGLRNIRANTLAFGGVLTPLGTGGPRLAVDYSRIRRSGDPFQLSQGLVLGNEALFPDRVTRLPLTDEDRAKGYTGGVIAVLDARVMNGTRRRVEAIDARFDWSFPLFGGRLDAYAAATYQMGLLERRPTGPKLERAGSRSGPLRWRSNGGFDWTRGPLALGANVQYFSHYRIAEPEDPSDVLPILQGSEHVKAQAYVDLYASRRFRIGNGARRPEITVDLGIVNLFDTPPPRETTETQIVPPPGYSFYSDPRRRRFELVISSRF